MLEQLKYRLESNQISVEFSDEAVEKIASEGFDPIYGARPLRRAIQSEIEDKIAEEMLESKVKPGDCVVVTVQDEKFICMPKENK